MAEVWCVSYWTVIFLVILQMVIKCGPEEWIWDPTSWHTNVPCLSTPEIPGMFGLEKFGPGWTNQRPNTHTHAHTHIIYIYIYIYISHINIYVTCTCMPIYIHTYIHTYIPTYLPTYLHTYIPTYIPTYLHTYIPTYLHTYIPTYLHTYIPTHLHTYIPTYLHTYIPTYLHTYIHTYIQTHTHIYIYIHIETRTKYKQPNGKTNGPLVTHSLAVAAIVACEPYRCPVVCLGVQAVSQREDPRPNWGSLVSLFYHLMLVPSGNRTGQLKMPHLVWFSQLEASI